MNRVRTALTRKIGPLPAWVWALALGAIVYIVRNRAKAQQGGGSAADTAYYGPYGQDYYPIQGGAGSATGESTGAVPPPTINIPGAPPHHPGKPGKTGKNEKPKGKHKTKTGTHAPGNSKKGTKPGHNKGTSAKSRASHNVDRSPAHTQISRHDLGSSGPSRTDLTPTTTRATNARPRPTQLHPAPRATAKVSRPAPNDRIKPATRKGKR